MGRCSPRCRKRSRSRSTSPGRNSCIYSQYLRCICSRPLQQRKSANSCRKPPTNPTKKSQKSSRESPEPALELLLRKPKYEVVDLNLGDQSSRLSKEAVFRYRQARQGLQKARRRYQGPDDVGMKGGTKQSQRPVVIRSVWLRT